MINKLALSAICLGGLIGAGCVVVEEGEFEVTWQLDPGCQAGAAAQVVAENVSTGVVYTDTFDCIDGGGIISRLPVGDYDISVDVLSGDLSGRFALSDRVRASLFFDGDFVLVDVPTFLADEGFFSFTWEIVDAGGVVECTDVFATDAILASSSSAIALGSFDCNAHTAVTTPVVVGDYSIFLDLIGGDGTPVASSEVVDTSIEFGNHLNLVPPQPNSVTGASFEFTFE